MHPQFGGGGRRGSGGDCGGDDCGGLDGGGGMVAVAMLVVGGCIMYCILQLAGRIPTKCGWCFARPDLAMACRMAALATSGQLMNRYRRIKL